MDNCPVPFSSLNTLTLQEMFTAVLLWSWLILQLVLWQRNTQEEIN